MGNWAEQAGDPWRASENRLKLRRRCLQGYLRSGNSTTIITITTTSMEVFRIIRSDSSKVLYSSRYGVGILGYLSAP